MDNKHATRNRLRTMAIFCLVLILTVVSTVNAGAQAGEPGVCDGSPDSICGFPIAGNPAEMTGRAFNHDSCIPEGSCPWIQGVDIWWPGNPSSTERPTDLLSVMKGKVVTARCCDGANNPVIAIRNAYFLCFYLHADKIYVTAGQDVEIGTPLGLMGQQGRASHTTHVHFACKRNSTGDRGASLTLAEMAPMYKGWATFDGLDPSAYSGPVTGESNAGITIDDLPYAEANQVEFFLAYTPTPEFQPTATLMPIVPTNAAPVIVSTITATPDPTATNPTLPPGAKKFLPWIILALLLLALMKAPDENEGENKGHRSKGEGGPSE